MDPLLEGLGGPGGEVVVPATEQGDDGDLSLKRGRKVHLICDG